MYNYYIFSLYKDWKKLSFFFFCVPIIYNFDYSYKNKGAVSHHHLCDNKLMQVGIASYDYKNKNKGTKND